MTIEQVLRQYGNDLVQQLKREIVQDGGVATGRMTDTLDYEVVNEGGVWTLYLVSTDYLKWWDQGTYPHWAPIQPLKDWASAKLPDADASFPYRVQWKIAREGTEPHDRVNAVAELTYDRYERELQEAILDDLGYLLKGIPGIEVKGI